MDKENIKEEKEMLEQNDELLLDNTNMENNVEEVIIHENNSKSKRKGNSQTCSNKGINKPLIITAIILIVIVISMVVFALVNKLNKNVYSNVYIGTTNLSGKTEEEVVSFVKTCAEEFEKKAVAIKYEDNILMEITADTIDMKINEEATINNIMSFGRNENIIQNNLDIVKAFFNKKQIEIVYEYSEAKLTNISAEVTSGIEGRVKDDSYRLDEENYNLVITRGTSGKDIIVDEFKTEIVDVLKNDAITEYKLNLEIRQPKAIDIDVVFANVHKDAKDAYVDETVKPIVYHKHEVGISFDKNELRKVLEKSENQGEGKIIKFKLTTTQPKIKIQDITKDIYKDRLATYTSSYVNSDSNRASNVVLGAKMLNGTIIMPGETFSFNKVMGDCGLSSRGFKPAAVFKGGKVVQEVGGGICQISSTLYVSVLYANLQIVSRSNHALPVGYVPVSLDATVYYPYLDFKFKNTREYPIKIVATTTSSRKLTIAIYGTKEEKEYDVELSSYRTATIASKVETKQDSSLENGKTKVIQAGTAGYKSVAYKTVKYKGKVISKVLLSQDSYGSTPKIVAIGTKEVHKEEPSKPTTGTTTPETQPETQPSTQPETQPGTPEGSNEPTAPSDSTVTQ